MITPPPSEIVKNEEPSTAKFVVATESMEKKEPHERKPWDTPEEIEIVPSDWPSNEGYLDGDDEIFVHVNEELDAIPDWEQDPKSMKQIFNRTVVEMRASNAHLLSRLNRRLDVIGEIKSAYLRDIITMKSIFENMLSKVERKEAIEEWRGALPSLDFSRPLALYSPSEAMLQVKPCESCGGRLEIQYCYA